MPVVSPIARSRCSRVPPRAATRARPAASDWSGRGREREPHRPRGGLRDARSARSATARRPSPSIRRVQQRPRVVHLLRRSAAVTAFSRLGFSEKVSSFFSDPSAARCVQLRGGRHLLRARLRPDRAWTRGRRGGGRDRAALRGARGRARSSRGSRRPLETSRRARRRPRTASADLAEKCGRLAGRNKWASGGSGCADRRPLLTPSRLLAIRAIEIRRFSDGGGNERLHGPSA